MYTLTSYARDCSKTNSEVGEEVHRGSLHEKLPTDVRRELLERRILKSAKKSIEDRSTKFSQPMCARDCSKTNFEVGEEVHRRSLHEIFPTDVRRESLKRRILKLAKKSIEDRSTKFSQPMCVENRSKKNSEVGEEVHRRSLHEIFPTDVRPRLLEDEF